MKLTYWKIQHQKDSNCFSIRAKTKKEAIAQLDNYWDRDAYTEYNGTIEVQKIEVEYSSAYDLMEQLLCESSADFYESKTYIIQKRSK